MGFHEKLQELRKSRSMTQEELAKELFVSRTAISKWESGKDYPNIDSIKEISRFFSVTIDDLLTLMKGISDCSYEEFQYALSVGVTAPFYLAKLLLPFFNPGGSIINISSSRNRMSQPQTESYTAAKGGIAALTHALSDSLGRKVRVNSISPGWINTTDQICSGADAVQQPCGRVGNPLDIAA